MIYLGICDDDKEYLDHAAEFLLSQAGEWRAEATVSAFTTLEELMGAAEDPAFRMDMLFLDIEFQEGNSLEAAKEFSSKHPRCHIVFLTNYLSYALDVYEIPHLYYVVKAEFPERIRKIFSAYFRDERNSRLTVSVGSTVHVIPLKDIFYIERMRLSSRIVTGEENLRATDLFETLTDKIQAPYMVRCHNSFLVNLQHVKKYQTGKFEMINGEEIPISRAYQKSVREYFNNWMDVWI